MFNFIIPKLSLRASLCCHIHTRLFSVNLIGSLRVKNAHYNNVDVSIDDSSPVIDASFNHDLQTGLRTWKTESRTAVWLRLDVKHAYLSPIAIKSGFDFYSAHGRSLVLVKWLLTNVQSKLPPVPFTQIGVGCFVLNSCNQILMIKERNTAYDRFKIPGGLVDPKESLTDAAHRELKEETGVHAVFTSVLSFWHQPVGVESKSDMYIVCRAHLDDEHKINNDIVIDPYEVRECRWVGIDEFLTFPSAQQHPMVLKILEHNFGIDEPTSGLKKVQSTKGTIQPDMEMEMQKLKVAPTLAPFSTFFCKNRRMKENV